MQKLLSGVNKSFLAFVIVACVTLIGITIKLLVMEPEVYVDNSFSHTDEEISDEDEESDQVEERANEYEEICAVKEGEITAGFTLYDIHFDDDLMGCRKIYRRVAGVNSAGDYIIKVNNEPIETYNNVSAYSLTISPDGKRIAFFVEENGMKYMVLDGVKGEGFNAIYSAQFSPDGKHFVYGAWTPTETGGRHCVVVYDGEKYGDDKEYSAVEDFTFSSDSKIFSYAGRWGYTGYEINRIGGESDMLIAAKYVYSPDGEHLAYIVQEEDGYYVDFDGVAGKKYDYIAPNSIVFSSDSEHMAYTAKIINDDGTSEYRVVSDGKEGISLPEYDSPSESYNPIQNITYYQGGSHMAYIVRSHGDKVCYRSYSIILDDVLILDDKSIARTDCQIENCNSCEFAADMSLSENGKYFAFVSPEKTTYGIVDISAPKKEWVADTFELDVETATGKDEKGWIKNIAIDTEEGAVIFDIITKSGKTFVAKEYFVK